MFRIVLVRHGQSTWNKENKFTGWTDVPLSPAGEKEALRAAGQLLAAGLDFDICYTSFLKRAIKTLWLIQEAMDRMWLPVVKQWCLNERHYGALQGLDKGQTAAQYGEEQVFQWRRGYAVRPPALPEGDPRLPEHDPRYSRLQQAGRPRTESLADTVARVLPYWNREIVPRIQENRRVLLVAHGNSLRALVKHLEGVSDEAITGLNIPTGIPLVYELGPDMKAIGSYYLGDAEEAATAAAEVQDQGTASRSFG
ncbi:2,3-diphosphoglycerate-dependent phosphoglycerate mutase [Desulfohalobium retbaense]|uniref:2,3-bisphosphoglycerate-dependent phosphoglycerate mutase n=1 Tax=Desulfohalobium retbaense (strain ATCC 49708 / DSM 5692 / JCM 16813 / HR100) TaxID=485915 RepID=C8X0W8_DESRD|nr:2,3-diphosphoglycerate-dependent phosphoglycerate mutase [Desulfohalobium retbaense]ACV68065.1 phosphoglycerate mutase 1 family [Desulfohalobium retbaense DSM 5692]